MIEQTKNQPKAQTLLPSGDALTRNIAARRRSGTVWRWLLLMSPVVALVAQELVAILQENVSAGRFRTLNRENPLESRSKDEVYTLVLDEVARQRVVHS